MIYVTSVDKTRVEPLTNILDDFRMEETSEGSLTVSFTTTKSDKNLGYELLSPECIVNVYGYEFKITNHREVVGSKKVSGNSTFFNLGKHRQNDIYGGTRTFKDRIDFALSGTGWTATFDDDIVNKWEFIANYGEDFVVKLINLACEAYEVEYLIGPNNTIHFSTTIGGESDSEFRYKRNVGDVALVEDSSNLYTRIKGTGADDLEVVYDSPNQAIFGVLEADPVTNDQITTAEELHEWLSKQIEDVPKIAIETAVPELTSRQTGEKVWFIYEPLNILMQTRILQNTKIIRNGKLVTSKVVFGNILPKSLTSMYVEQIVKIDENDKRYRSRFEQTNRLIHMEVERIGEDISSLTLTADQIRSEVMTLDEDLRSTITQTASDIRTQITALDVKFDGELETVTTNYQSLITQTADAIRTDVSGLITEVNNEIAITNRNVSNIQQTTNGISASVSSLSTTVEGYTTRISNAESLVSQTATEVSSKVSWSDYNGQQIASLITQTATDYSISASKINLTGATMVNGNITGTGSISISTDATIGKKLYLSVGTVAGECGIQFGNSTRDWNNSYIKATYDPYNESSSNISVNASNDLFLYGEQHINLNAFYGDITMNCDILDLSGAYSINWGTNKPTAVWG